MASGGRCPAPFPRRRTSARSPCTFPRRSSDGDAGAVLHPLVTDLSTICKRPPLGVKLVDLVLIEHGLDVDDADRDDVLEPRIEEPPTQFDTHPRVFGRRCH